MRKTIPIGSLKDYVNGYLLHSADHHKEAREAMMIMLENFLHDTGNYNGFRYISKEEMLRSRDGLSYGILDGSFENTDHTRVYYY